MSREEARADARRKIVERLLGPDAYDGDDRYPEYSTSLKMALEEPERGIHYHFGEDIDGDALEALQRVVGLLVKGELRYREDVSNRKCLCCGYRTIGTPVYCSVCS